MLRWLQDSVRRRRCVVTRCSVASQILAKCWMEAAVLAGAVSHHTGPVSARSQCQGCGAGRAWAPRAA